MFDWLFGRNKLSNELLQLNLDRISFLMGYLQQHAFKPKNEVVRALNRELLLAIPEELKDPEGTIWPDPSNQNLAISFNCLDPSHPDRVTSFGIHGFEALAGATIIGTATDAKAVGWRTGTEFPGLEAGPLTRAVNEALWKMPGWKTCETIFSKYKYLQKI